MAVARAQQPDHPDVPTADPATGKGWRGELTLGFARRGDCTRLVRRRHRGPLVVQRTFHPEGAPCHAYVLHPPGGLVGGDVLRLDLQVEAGAHALLTTPGAAKFYRSLGDWEIQDQAFRVESGAALEWLPMETILHGGSRTRLLNRFALAGDARLIAWEMVALGRPGSGDHFPRGDLDQQLRVNRNGQPLLRERLAMNAEDPLRDAPWGLQGRSVLGTLLATPAPERLIDPVREVAYAAKGLRVGVTRLPEGLLLVRVLGPGVEPVRRVLEQVWRLIREPVIGCPPCPPRIWTT